MQSSLYVWVILQPRNKILTVQNKREIDRNDKAREEIIKNAEFVFEGATRSRDVFILTDRLGRKVVVESAIVNITKVFRGNIRPGTVELIGLSQAVAMKGDQEHTTYEVKGTDSIAIFFCSVSTEYPYNPKYDIYQLDNKINLTSLHKGEIVLGIEKISASL